MYDINLKIIEGLPYKYNIYSMPINFPCNKYNESIKDSVIVQSFLPISDDFGTLQYVGGICVNNKIYCTPNCADDILVYDIENDSTYKICSGLGTNKFKYTGQVYYKGKIYMLHRGTNSMIEINPNDDTYRLIGLKLGYTVNPYDDYRDSYHYNGVLSDQGYLYQPPAYNNTDLLKINMETFSVQKISFISDKVDTWIGCVKHPKENKIIFLSTKIFRIWNCDNDTYIDIVSENEQSCYDMVYDSRYNSFIGVSAKAGVFQKWIAINLDDYTITESSWVNYMVTGYGICIGLDGNYYHLEGKTAFVASYDGNSFSIKNSVTTSEDMGDESPYIAGQAIDAKGNIYGIPASGKMCKITFTGVDVNLPEWIIKSQFYGKY